MAKTINGRNLDECLAALKQPFDAVDYDVCIRKLNEVFGVFNYNIDYTVPRLKNLGQKKTMGTSVCTISVFDDTGATVCKKSSSGGVEVKSVDMNINEEASRITHAAFIETCKCFFVSSKEKETGTEQDDTISKRTFLKSGPCQIIPNDDGMVIYGCPVKERTANGGFSPSIIQLFIYYDEMVENKEDPQNMEAVKTILFSSDELKPFDCEVSIEGSRYKMLRICDPASVKKAGAVV